MKQISPALRDDFTRNGYIYIPQFLNAEEVNNVHRQLEKFIREKVPVMPAEHVFYEDQDDPSSLKQLQTLYTYDSFFYQMMFESPFQQLAETLLTTPAVGKNMQYFNKPAGKGKPTPPHQDGYYFKLEPNEALTIWLGLDDVDDSNGCVRYIKGSHRQGMRLHSRTNTLGFSQGITDYGDTDSIREVWFSTKPGDLLAHHSLTIHRADANNSANKQRRALGFIYYSGLAKENNIEKNKYQQQLKDEISNSKS